MSLTRRKAVLAFGAAVFAPLLAPGKAAAHLFGRRRHRRVACSQPFPGGLHAPKSDETVRGIPLCTPHNEAIGSASVGTPPIQFKFGTSYTFTIVPASGSTFGQNGGRPNGVTITEQQLANTGPQNVAWNVTQITLNGGNLSVNAIPEYLTTCPLPLTSGGLTVTVFSNYSNGCSAPWSFPYASSQFSYST